jgi:hypothetical protein
MSAGMAHPRSARASVERDATLYRLEQLASVHESTVVSPARRH